MVEEYYVIENDISCEVENADRKEWRTLIRGKQILEVVGSQQIVEAGFKWLCNNEFGSLDIDGDAGGVQQSIVNQAVLDRLFDAFQVFLVEAAGDFDGNAKIVKARGILDLVSGDTDDSAFGRQIMFFQVLRGVKGSAGA